MNRINTDGWGEFKISDIFETLQKGKTIQVPTGANVQKKDLIEKEISKGGIPRITVTGVNNGIYGYYEDRPNDDNYRVYENFISVSFLGTVFYQRDKASLDMKVHCLKPLRHKLNDYTGKYLVAAILASLRDSSYSDQISSSVLPTLSVKLPKDKDGNPDWIFMEEYNKSTEEKVKKSLKELQAITQEVNCLIDTTGWGEFRADKLFNIKKGKRLRSQDRTEGNTPYIGALNHDNGLFQMIGENPIFEGNTISVNYNSSAIGQSYYQDIPYWATDDVNVWYFKDTNDYTFNKYIALFVCAVIIKIGKKYKYTDKWKIDDMESCMLRLPKNEKGNPDWRYMEEHMKSIERKVKNSIATLDY